MDKCFNYIHTLKKVILYLILGKSKNKPIILNKELVPFFIPAPYIMNFFLCLKFIRLIYFYINGTRTSVRQN